MASNPVNDLRAFCDKIRATLGDAVSQTAMRPLGEQMVNLVVTRTRLGYGVPDGPNGVADRFKLQSLSPGYVSQRNRGKPPLSEFTTPSRSNLTRTGQMLGSVNIVAITPGTVRIGPRGSRKGGGPTNAQVARYVAEQGRPWLSLSRLEVEQLTRFYRNTFGDLLRNRRLT